MKTFRHFWRYLAKLFLEWEMFKTKVVEKIKTHILYSTTFFRKSHRLWDNVEECSGDRRAINDVTTWRIRVSCWISKAICTYEQAHAHAPGYPMHARTRKHAHTDQYIIIIAFPQQQWFRERTSMLRYTYIVCIVSFARWTLSGTLRVTIKPRINQ
jgi:hypothetical protein